MSTYFSILTEIGEAKIANALAQRRTLKFTHMAVGDGNGAVPVPNRKQVALVKEQHRAPINNIEIDENNPSQLIIEQVIPADVGGFWVREIAIIDEDGDVCAVANCPPSLKPVLADGAGKDQIVRVVLIVSATAAIELKIDPAVVLATRKYVNTEILAYAAPKDHTHADMATRTYLEGYAAEKNHTHGDLAPKVHNHNPADVIPGGLVGQVLRKRTNDSGDVEWVNLDLGNPLDASKNLKDISDPVEARKNIGASMALTGVPLMWPTLECPAWALVRDGSAYPRATYVNLFNILAPVRVGNITQNAGGAIVSGLSRTLDLWVGMPYEHSTLPAGTTIKSIDGTNQITLSANSNATTANAAGRFFLHGYGNGGGSATFGLPDDRGLFERALDSNRGYDVSNVTATVTKDSNVISGLSSTRGLFVGQPIAAAGIPAGATITSILSATAITMTAAATATNTGAITVTGRQAASEEAHSVESHNHNNSYGAGLVFGAGPNVYDYTSGTSTSRAFAMSSYGGPETRPRNRAYLPIIIY